MAPRLEDFHSVASLKMTYYRLCGFFVYCLFVFFWPSVHTHPKPPTPGRDPRGATAVRVLQTVPTPPSSHTHTNTHLHFYLLFKHFKNHLPLASRGAASAASVVGNVLSSKRGSRDGEGDLPASKPGTVRQPPQ